MKNEKQTAVIKDLKLFSLPLWLWFFSLLLAGLWVSACWAVSSKVTRHSSGADLLKGQTEDIVVGSKGTLQLGRSAEALVEKFELVTGTEPWSVSSIVVSGGTVFVGTSPNGGVYKYSLDKLTKIYPLKSQENESAGPANLEPNEVNEPGDANAVRTEQYLSNKHIFAMATDLAGRLLAGVSGEKCRLIRFEADKPEVIFEPNDANKTKYIFAIDIDPAGNIYLATGPQGKLYQLDSFGKQSQLIYDSTDKNILSLAIDWNSSVYAGSDSRGLVYKINPRAKTATVLYDSDQEEITALLFAENSDLYAAATSAKLVAARAEFAAQLPLPGRPELPQKSQTASQGEGGLKLKIANTKKQADVKPPPMEMPTPKETKPRKASYIYRITKEGFVTDIFSEVAVFFCLAAQQQQLLVGTGNPARLFTVDPDSEQQAVIYEHKQASQITAVAVAGDDVYIGTANPAKLIKLSDAFAAEGTYTSDLIDAGQPAKWGKLQIEADIPEGCKVSVASRSGNVKDINDPTFSDWTESAEVTEPIQLRCPLGRFCQYKLVLHSEHGRKSPLIREIAVASTVPNLAPKVEEVTVGRVEAAGKTGVFKISYKTRDDNGDKLIYRIDFRKLGRTSWIELEDEIGADSFEWDGRTLEDGRYEVRVTANDERSNTTATGLTGSRISDPVVVDNAGPVIKRYTIDKDGANVTLKLMITDEFSVIGRTDYTVDSNAKWLSTVPDDLVYDTTEEHFTILIEDLEPGEHVIAVKASDDLGNTTYKTFEIETAKGEK